jgi:hypothetical protein
MMAIQSALQCDIREPYSTIDTKCAILNSIWGTKLVPQQFSKDVSLGNSYLRYYSEQCINALHSNGINDIVSTHADIVGIIERLREPDLTRESLKDHLRERFPNLPPDNSEALICETIDLAVRLWLMIDVGELFHGFVPGQKSLSWERGVLKDLLVNYFSPPITMPMRVVRVKLDRIFTARNLERIAGLQIIWTSNILDHLRLMVDDTRIAIYHHASCLEHHKNNPLFPQGFIDETIRTLSLLFPEYDKKSRKWFKAQRNKYGLDEKASTSGHLTTEERQIERFVFWHDRLGILKQVFDEAEPSTIAQWWRDRRRRVQWYTFWVAAMVLALTIFFGMIQCIEGGFQVYKAYYPS